MNALEMLGDWASQLFGVGRHAGKKSGLHHNMDQLLSMNTSGSLLGSIFHSEGGFLANPERTWKHWMSQLEGGGGDDRSEDRSADPIIDPDTPTVDDTISLDPGVDQTTAPMFTDVSMTASRQTARSALGSRGYDTGTSKGRSVTDVNKKRYGTAVTRNMA